MSVKFMKMIAASALCSFTLLAMMACSMATLMPQSQVKTAQEVPSDMVVIVGRIELRPPLQPAERSLMTMRGDTLKDTFILYCGERVADLNSGAPAGPVESFTTTLENDFFIKVRRHTPLIISGGTFSTASGPPLRIEAHAFNSPLQVELRPDDQAVYIGTIQYYRDGSGALKSVMIRDDYRWATGAFRERFGTFLAIRKALAMPPRGQ